LDDADTGVLIDALFLLARTQLELQKPAAALGTLDLLPQDPALRVRERPLRIKGLLYLNRFDEAMAMDATADEWLDGMSYAIDMPQALAIKNEIEYRFGTALSPEQQERLVKLNAQARKPRAARSETGLVR
jgi:hypothetical protein